MLTHRHSKMWTALAVVVIASLACNIFSPAPTATPAFTPIPAASPTPLPPIPPNVIDQLPERGDELAPNGTITVYFDSPMNRSTVEAAFAIAPQVKGTFNWPDDATLVFKPETPFERASRYTVTIGTGAQSAAGLALAKEAMFKAETVGFLEVTQVLPAPDTQGADVTSVITVMFNRPVVPLTSLADQARASVPNPLTLGPAVEGKGEWLNTSIFVFRPSKPLLGGQKYAGTIQAGLQDTTGGLLKDDFTWSFDTAAPTVISTDPFDGATGLALTRPISLTFNQLMDHPSTEAAFALTASDGSAVAGLFQWSEDGLTLGFVPSGLALGTQYTARIGASALSANGGASLSQPYEFTFQSVLAPGILTTDPADGAHDVPTYSGFRIYFASPMDVSTLDGNITILPEPTQVYTYWNDYDFSYYVGWNLKPSTDYEVTLGAGMKDPYGNTISEGRVVHFTTGPLQPQAYFNAGGQVGTYSAYAANTETYVSTVNVNRLQFSLYRLSLEEFAAFTGPDSYLAYQNYQPKPGATVREWSVNVESQLNQLILTRVPLLAEGGGALDPGVYFLRMSAPELSDQGPQTQLLVVSGANLTLKTSLTGALVWATDLNSGQPLANLPITIYSQNFSRLAEGQTDSQGVFTADIAQLTDLWTGIYAVSEGGPGKDSFAVARSDWSTGLDPWDFNVPSQFYPTDLAAYLYTDRPLYRPGQVVYFKGVLRKENDARFSLPELGAVSVAINNDQGEMVYSDTLKLTPFGTFSGEFNLADEAGLGFYNLYLSSEKLNVAYNGVSFSVAEYRKPEFQVNVTSPVTQTVQGATIPATVEASFFFGGPVSNADVHWSVLAADYVFQYTGQGYYDFYNFDYSSGAFGPQYGTFGKLIAEKDGKTDAQGKAAFEVKADLSDTGVSQVYTIEANVTDPAGGQQVAGRTQVIVHQGQFYVGVRPEVYVAEAGKPVGAQIVTVDWNSDAFPNQNVHVVYNDHQWNCAQEQDPSTGSNVWTCHVKDTEVASDDVTTDAKGNATSAFTPPEGGVYQVKVTGTDAGGRTVTAATYLWVSEPGGYVTWRQDNNDRLVLVTDRKSYKPGDTAEILIPSPFQGSATALITIERGRILEHRVVTLTDNSTVYRLPITADYAPDVFFSVVIVKGVDALSGNPTPAFKIGLAKLTVSPEQQALTVTLTPDKTKVGPRDTVTYAIKATDYLGKPVQAEFSVAVVDLALLSLSGPNSGPILDAFYGERGLGVRTGLGLTLSVDRFNVAAERAKGGGGGAEAGFNEVRTNFLDTAFWNAAVATDANGEASVAVTLPDNLTTWRLDARGLTARTLVGQGTTDIVATKDLLIRPQTPRFFVVGDQAQLAAVVNNNTAQDIQATVTLVADAGVDLSSPAAQNVTVKANDRVEVTWDVTVQDVSAVDLTFSVEGGGLRDASKPTLGIPPNQLLPVYKYSAPETVATAGQLDSANSVLEAVSLPRRFDVTQGELIVQLDPSLAAAMTGGLDYLEHYPYECTEQTVSRFLPNVLTYKALKDLGLSDPKLEEKLSSLVRLALQRLYARQHVDGGWGWWANDQSDPYVSAYVVFGLVKAQQAGFAVSEGVLSSGIAFLQNYSNVPVGESGGTHGLRVEHPLQGAASLAPIPATDYVLNRTVFILYVLAEAGQPNVSSTVQVYDNRDRLDTYARAYLAQTLYMIDQSDTRLKTLLSDINNKAILSATGAHWEEAATDWWNMNTDTRSTAIVLDTLVRLDPKNNLIPNVVRWLMVARKAQAWETTQETAWALIGLSDWMVVSGELKANYQYNVTLNGNPLTAGEANAGNLRDSVTLRVAVADLLKDQANRLVVNRGAGDGRLYYTAHLNVYFPVEDVRALSRGVTVAREYTLKSGDCGGRVNGVAQPACPQVTEVKAGEDIQVRVTLIAPHDLYYVVLEDPIPAGTEAVDTSLLTTSAVGQPPQLNSADPLYYGWGWWWFSNTDLRDEKVVLFATYLPKGTYEYTYTLHASRPGVYKVIPTNAYEFYFPEVFGRGDGMVFTIKP